MRVPVWLGPEDPFPPMELWCGWEVAYGGDLSVERLLTAYRQGIFPWYDEGEPIRWCSPDPRAVLPPHLLHIPRRLWREWSKHELVITADMAFEAVVEQCATVFRRDQVGTWITAEMKEAYAQLHKEGYAHSVECWLGSELVGGLYGVQLGPLFVGESMFHRRTNASKIAFLALCGHSLLHQIQLIDCQVFTEHLAQFGVFPVPRRNYLAWLRTKLPESLPRMRWSIDIHQVDEVLSQLIARKRG